MACQSILAKSWVKMASENWSNWISYRRCSIAILYIFYTATARLFRKWGHVLYKPNLSLSQPVTGCKNRIVVSLRKGKTVERVQMHFLCCCRHTPASHRAQQMTRWSRVVLLFYSSGGKTLLQSYTYRLYTFAIFHQGTYTTH